MKTTGQTTTWRFTNRDVPAWAASVAFHAMLLVVLSLITWVATRPAETNIDVALLPDDVADGLLRAAGAPGDAGDLRAARDPARGERDLSSLAMRTPQPPPDPIMAPPAPLSPIAPDDASKTAPPHDAALDMVGALLEAPSGSTRTAQPGPGGKGGTRGDLIGPGGPGRGMALDVVFILDATRSMTPTIADAKTRIYQTINVINGMLASLGRVRSARFGVVVFKDYGDEFGPGAVRTFALSDDHQAVRQFIEDIEAGGGADEREPIDRALDAAAQIKAMGWTNGRRALMVLISDAPIHAIGREAALQTAQAWVKRLRQAQIVVLDTGGSADNAPLRTQIRPDLLRVAEAGNGAAFLMSESLEYWKYVIVSLFGRQYEPSAQQFVDKFAADTEQKP